MDEQMQDDQLEPTYNSSVAIKDVALKTYQKWWTIERGGGRGSEIFVLMAQYDDDLTSKLHALACIAVWAVYLTNKLHALAWSTIYYPFS